MGRPGIPVGGIGEVRPKQVKDRLWSVRVRWRDDLGEYHRTLAEAPSKKQCEDLVLARIAEERQQLRASLTTSLSLDEVAERWFTSLERSKRRPSTIAQYRATWRGTLSPVLGREGIDALTRARVQQALLDELFARKPGHRGGDGRWIPGEYRTDEHGRRIPLHGEQPRTVMRLLLRFAADRGYRSDGINPLDGTETPERREPVVRVLTDEEADRLIEMAAEWYRTGHGASSVLWHGLVLLRYTGLRIGEALALTWGDVNLDGEPPTIRVHQTLTESRSGLKAGLGPTKGGTIDMIALADPAVAVLRARRPEGWESTQFVFATRSGRPVTQANFRRALRDRVRGTELAWTHPHSFRKTLATKADQQHDLEAARDLLRHKDVQITQRHYVIRDAVRVLDPRSLFTDCQD
jgi:integrase